MEGYIMEIRFVPATTLKAKPLDETKLGFVKIFTDYMFEMNYSVEKGWHDPRVTPFHNFELSPAAMVLHYSQTIFEGLKMYRTKDGFQLFRPRDNFKRMNVSAERMAIPAFDVETAMAGLMKLLEADKEWTPSLPGTSLYIRPFIIATDPFVGVRSGYTYTFCIILSPVGAYYASGLEPVGIYVEDNSSAPCVAAWALPRPAATTPPPSRRATWPRKRATRRSCGWTASSRSTSRKSAR
jgi:branched-chain amino acid aminotransferase